MTNYKRFISYLYFYEAGKKQGNVGYARVETSDELCKVTIHCTTKIVSAKECKVYLMKRSKSSTIGKQVGIASARDGVLDMKLSFDQGFIEDADFNAKESQGIVLVYSKDNYIAAKWDDSNVTLHDVMLLEQGEDSYNFMSRVAKVQKTPEKIDENPGMDQVEAAMIDINQERKAEPKQKMIMVDASDIVNLGKISEIKEAKEKSLKESLKSENVSECSEAIDEKISENNPENTSEKVSGFEAGNADEKAQHNNEIEVMDIASNLRETNDNREASLNTEINNNQETNNRETNNNQDTINRDINNHHDITNNRDPRNYREANNNKDGRNFREARNFRDPRVWQKANDAARRPVVDRRNEEFQPGQRPEQQLRPQVGQRPEQQIRPQVGQRPEQQIRPQAGQRPEQQIRPQAGLRPEQHARPQSGQRPDQQIRSQVGQRPEQLIRPQEGQRADQQVRSQAEQNLDQHIEQIIGRYTDPHADVKTKVPRNSGQRDEELNQDQTQELNQESTIKDSKGNKEEQELQNQSPDKIINEESNDERIDKSDNEVTDKTNEPIKEEFNTNEEEPIDDLELKQETVKAANCAVPNPNLWADHPSARAILNRFVRMYPFDDGEIAECVRLEPKDIGLLPMSSWVLGNNSFLLHAYCNFRHLLFAKKLTREGCVYLLMVPGAHNNREQQLAKMFGFENFKCSRRRSLRDGEFGYWYVTITFD